MGAAPARRAWTPAPRGRLSGPQFAALMLLSVFPTIILLVPDDLVRAGGRYGWWTPIVAAPPAALLGWAAGRLAGRLGDAVGAARRSWGPLAGRALLAAVWVALGMYVTTIAREVTESALATIVSGSLPLWLMTAVCVGASALLAWWGPVVLGRTAVVVAPLLVAVFLGVAAATLPSAHLAWTLPLWPDNIRFARWLPLSRMWVWTAEPAFLAAALANRAAKPARGRMGRTLVGVVAAAAAALALQTWLVVAKLGPQGGTVLAIALSGIASSLGFGPQVLNLETAIFPVVTLGSIVKLALFLWVWARVGSAAAGVRLKTALLVQVAMAGYLSIVTIGNLPGLERAFSLLGDAALPVLVASTLLAYARAARRSPPA